MLATLSHAARRPHDQFAVRVRDRFVSVRYWTKVQFTASGARATLMLAGEIGGVG